ncbi:hypothetical protein [Streptomyces tubercidicus]|uniref:hypothetical protein n=1 Tax=Streptomyces tubercidicus TaxID=47759 RepID=UPI0034679C4E
MPLPFPTPEQRQALCDWLTANDINPDDVCEHTCPRAVTLPNGKRVIQYSVFLSDTDGHVVGNDHEIPREERTAPLIVEPPTPEKP